MEVEQEKNIELVYSHEIKKFSGLSEKLKSLQTHERCSNTGLLQSCTSTNCSVILYYNKTYTGIHGNLDNLAGFITLLSTTDKAGEVYNLCSAHPTITESLLKYTIKNIKSTLWIGIHIESPYFEENVGVFVDLGFGHPIISSESPSGIPLGYKFMAFIRPTIERKVDIRDKAIALRKEFLNPPPKFKNLPRPTMNIRVSQPTKKSTSNVKTPPPKPAQRTEKKRIIKTPPPVSSFVKSPAMSPSPEKKKSKKSDVEIKFIGTNPDNNPVPIKRKDRDQSKETYLQNSCLDDYHIDGKILNDQELSGLDLKTVEEKLREAGYIYEGAYGVVYRICDINNDCNYVMKIQNLGAFTKNARGIDMEPKAEYAANEWKKEVEVAIELNKYGIGAKITSAWLCANETKNPDGSIKRELLGIFASEKWDGNLEGQPCISRELVEKLENQVNIIHRLGYVHMDIFPKNILMKKNWFGTITDVTLTDFGWVTPVETIKADREILNKFYEYHVGTFQQLTYLYYDGTITGHAITKGKFYNDPRLMDFDVILQYKYRCGYM